MLKKIISVVLAVMMAVSCTFMNISTVTAAEYIASGDWEQCHWEIDSNGKLTISGTIPTNNYLNGTPWYKYREEIKEVYAEVNTSTGENASYLFYDFKNATKIDLSNLDTSTTNKMNYMFSNCKNLSSLDISHFNTSNVINMTNMFSYCENLKSLDVSHFNTSKVTNMRNIFLNCKKLSSLDVSHFDTSKVTDMGGMFGNCKISALNVSSFNTSKVNDMSSMFGGCSNLRSLDIRQFNTSKVTNMDSMFYGCSNLISLDVSSFDTSNVTSMRAMFFFCDKFISLDLSHFDTSKVTDMSGMFEWCHNLKSLNLSNFDTSNVINMVGMFNSCQNLKSLNLSSFDTSNVTNMYAMFCQCLNLESINLSNFDTQKTSSMEQLFGGCKKLQFLDLSSFDTSNITNMSFMFVSCNNLKQIVVSNVWNVEKVTESDYMFEYCYNLIGGLGTEYNSNKYDKTYARIDGGTALPGYLTSKTQTNTIALGKCGENVTWELNKNNKLRIYGSGDMYDYSSFLDVPWYSYSYCIEEVEIDDGVSSIGENAFAFMISLQKITMGNSVSSIRENAFEYCTQLNEVELPESVGVIGKRAFMSSGMQTIIFNGNAPQFADKPFENVIADAYYNSNKTGWVNAIDADLGGEIDWYDINSPEASTIRTKHISYHKEHWYSSNALPQIPSNDISEYAEELYEWAVKYGVSDVLTKDKAKEVVEKYMPTVLYAEGDIVATEKEYKVWEIMRDVLMLNSTKKSLDKWEHDYLVSAKVKDLTQIQKKLAEIMDVYSSYTENCRNNPVAEVVYNILSQATGYDRDKTVFEMAKEKLSDDLKDEVLTIIQNGDFSSLEEKVDDLMELKLAWKEDGASSLKGYLWDIKENMTLDNAGKFFKKLAKKDFQHLIDTFINEHPNIKLLKDVRSEMTSYTGLFKKYSVIAEFCPGALLGFELLNLGKTLLQTVGDTKSAQYFMIQYYAYSHPELYDAIIQSDGSVVDIIGWNMNKLEYGISSESFINELMNIWYKTGAQSVSASSRIKLAGYAYNAATIQDMDIRYLQQAIVDFCVNEVSENKSGIGQITFTTNSNNGFKIKSGDTVVGTYNNGIFTQNGNSSENTNYNAIENNHVVITQNTDQSAVSVTLKDTSYQVVFDNQISPVAVSIINEDGTQQAELYDSNSTETTYSFNTGSLRVSDTNNNTVQSSESYLKESSMAVLDADNIVIGYAPNDSISSVTGNITLPSTGYFGSTISWYSSNPDVVGTDGSVKRQTLNCEVTLTATIKNGNSYCERNYILTVIGTDITVNIVLNGRYKTNYKTIAGSTLNINNLCSHIGLTKNNSCEWYFDEDKIYPIQNGCKINNNMTLYAFAEEYSIIVNQQAGGNIDIGQKTTALHGETVTLTAIPNEGYVVEKVVYGNSEADRNDNNSFSFVMPSEDVIISAEYKIGQYTITFDTNGGSKIAAITQDYNTVIAKPKNPVKDNAIFSGWSTAIPEKMPAQNMTIIAQWIELTKIEAKTANCTQNGNIEYYAGSNGKFYLLSNGVFMETEWNKIVINATGHDYVLDDEFVTDEGHALICTRCGDTIIQEHQYDEDNICTICGYGENAERIDWSKAVIEFTDNSNGLYAYNKKVIYPEFTVTYNGVVLEEYEDFDFTEDAETESKYSGKHTITIFDKNDETNTFSFDYYIYNLGITAAETANSDNKIKFTATRNTDKTNVMKFGIVFDRKGTFKENLSLESRTNISATTTKSTSKYNVNVADSGKGVYARPYIQITLNGENYIAYGEVKFFTRYTPEQIAVPTIQDIEPQLVNGKVSVKVQKPIYDTELYVCKEMGIIFSKNGTITSLENAQTSNILIYENIGNGNVSKGYVNGAKIGEQSLDNYSSYSANIGFVNGNPVYTRAYVIFTNKNTNEDMVVYGNYFVTNQ